ncbi:MAG: hypothetical protein R3199_07485, partial [Gemmatimonadota bacterium]|nr:hypothetical protein [Gemmatimonadota bacterium]
MPADFDFEATVRSHGWCRLAPFGWRPQAARLEYRFRLPGGGAATVAMGQPGGRGSGVELEVVGGTGRRTGLERGDRAAIEEGLRRALRLDESIAPFHELCREAGPPFDRAPQIGFGRLLRAPTAFEDLAKVLATTNTRWSGTEAMVAKLVELSGGEGTFPTAEEVVGLGPEALRKARWGYRAEYLVELASRVASGEIEPERWDAWPGTTAELEERIRELPGFGPYASAQVLGLMGRYDRIGVDSVFRAFVRDRHFPDRGDDPPTEARMRAVYRSWGGWRALAYWFEVWEA